jgi:hypothetical protein
MNFLARSNRNRGSTLVTVMVLGTATIIMAGSLLAWTTTNNRLSQRNNEYNRTVLMAEAATEKVIARIAYDYQLGGDAQNFANLNSYRSMVPLASEESSVGNYQFTDSQGNVNKTYVEYLPPSEFRVLTAQYRGLHGYSTAFRVVSNAKETTGSFGITAGVRQDIEVTTIPLFQFAIFYNLELEINPGPVMTVNGPVHGNYNIYLQPQNTLTFQGDVTSARNIINNKSTNDCSSRTPGTIVFQAEHDSGTSTLNLPIGTNNSPANVRQVIEVPPGGESPTSLMGQQRFYNKADLVITLSGSPNSPSVTMAVGRAAKNNVGMSIPANSGNFLKYTNAFYNKRENKTVRVVDIDIGNLKTWSENNTTLRPALDNQDVSLIYVNDQRTFSSSEEGGVRVYNGKQLPSRGLTVATPDPVYVQGDYNTKDSTGTSSGANTTHTKPAALIGDAITVLSSAWSDANSTKDLGSRNATGTTVNAAFLAGIVQSANCDYSGGVENFPRFLEDWGSDTFTYNGSMVVLYESKFAKGLWQGTGSSIGIYNPPNRSWAFDLNFRDPTKLPPGTPCVRALIRGSFAMLRPGTTTVDP